VTAPSTRCPSRNWDAVLQVHSSTAATTSSARPGRTSASRASAASWSPPRPAGLFGNFGQANYSAAKLGLVGLINTLAQGRWPSYDIKANAVAPIAATRMTEDISAARGVQRSSPRNYVAPVVAYLCTEEVPDSASVFIVGRRQGPARRAVPERGREPSTRCRPSTTVASQWSKIDDLSAAKQGELLAWLSANAFRLCMRASTVPGGRDFARNPPPLHTGSHGVPAAFSWWRWPSLSVWSASW